MIPAGPRVLVVDDHPLNARFAGLVLGRAGMQVVTADGGPAALARLEEGGFDVVLTDIAMPGMTGVELFESIRRRFGANRPRVVAYTAFALENERAAIAAAGFDAVLVKPSTAPQIVAAVLGPQD